MTGPQLDELVGNDLDAAERDRLRRTHDQLVTAGSPPELPPSLVSPPGSPERDETVRTLPRGYPRRRFAAAAVLAAALALAAFGAGFLVADRGGQEPFQTDFVLGMRGTDAAPAALASLNVGEVDANGNWPMILTVRELPPGKSYELLLTRRGKPAASCGTFAVREDKAEVFLNAPYKLRSFDGWVITPEDSDEILVRTATI